MSLRRTGPAAVVEVRTDPAAATLLVIDNGRGMSRAELRRFHDVAASTKTRGEGIGFAGVGIKLGLLVSSEVLTETRTPRTHVATTWRLSGRHRAPWQWTPPPDGGVVTERGTAVRLTLNNALSPLLDPGFVERALLEHFAPLFDPTFDEVLSAHYSGSIRFVINGRELLRASHTGGDLTRIALRLGRKRKPSAVGYLVREDAPLAERRRGVAISTLGKVIKRGWDWLGVSPAQADRITGLIEAPALAACLTLNKVDFIRSEPRGATYLAFRKAIQEVVSAQISAWGADHVSESQPRRAARPVERDLEAVLFALSGRFPLLATIVDTRPGGKRKMRVAERPAILSDATGDLFEPAPEEPLSTETQPPGDGGPEADRKPSEQMPAGAVEPTRVEAPGAGTKRRAVRLGLTIQFESRPAELELGRLVESTVWVNDAHPAYRRASASRSEGYHLALSVAMALAGVAVEPDETQAFVSEFLARWGDVHAPNGKGIRRRARL